MTRDAQEYINELVNKDRIYYLDISNRNLTGYPNLGDFTTLKNINASNNKFTDLNFLATLPNKNKLESINFFGNEINEVNFASLLNLFKNFPNLKIINLDNNPLNNSDLANLSYQQITFLVNVVEDKKLKINSWRGNLLLDLLKCVRQLREQLDNLQQSQAQIAVSPK